GESPVADVNYVLAGDDQPGRGGRGAVERHEVRPGFLEVEADGRGIDDLDLPYAGLQLGGGGSPGPLQAELHVVGRDRLAVVEAGSPAQLELVHEAVRTLRPRLGQAVADPLAGQGTHQRGVHRRED